MQECTKTFQSASGYISHTNKIHGGKYTYTYSEQWSKRFFFILSLQDKINEFISIFHLTMCKTWLLLWAPHWLLTLYHMPFLLLCIFALIEWRWIHWHLQRRSEYNLYGIELLVFHFHSLFVYAATTSQCDGTAGTLPSVTATILKPK